MMELMVGLKKYDEHMPKNPMERPFAHLKRGEDGKFLDDDLVNIMQTGIEEQAGKFWMLFWPADVFREIILVAFHLRLSPEYVTDQEYFRCFWGPEHPKMPSRHLHTWHEASTCLELRFAERVSQVLRLKDIRHV